ncbi:MAG: hypothetical protein M3162_01810 [Thermoproteota archaeon]|nr:hypothetical protein [Thermoproteota archaeon]
MVEYQHDLNSTNESSVREARTMNRITGLVNMMEQPVMLSPRVYMDITKNDQRNRSLRR